MKFKIISQSFADKSLESTIFRTFEYFATINKDRADKLEKQGLGNASVKESLLSLLQELVDYVELGLKNKYSLNFNVIICEKPNFAIKFEKGCILSLSYLDFVILVYKSPYICVPSKFHKKKLEDKENIEVDKSKDLLVKSLLNKDNYLMLNYASKENTTIPGLKEWNQDKITDVVFKNIAYCSYAYSEDKDFLGVLAQAIQSDLSTGLGEYSWGVVIGKKNLYSDTFIATSNMVYHSRIVSNSGLVEVELENKKKKETSDNKEIDSNNETRTERVKAPKLKDTEIFIYHKKAVFESPLKNIMSGRLRSVELKHIFIFFAVIIFFAVMGLCKSSAEELEERDDLSWTEENVCKNKSSIFSSLGVIFILLIVTGAMKKKIENKKKKNI